MRAIVCELCGGNDLLKTEDVYVCQHCGTRYTLEEARKLLVEANVTVSGRVSVEGVPTIENLLKRADDFESRGDLASAAEYYDRVLDIDFENNEARRGLARVRRMRGSVPSVLTTPGRKRVTGPNLIVDCTSFGSGSVICIFIDGKRKDSMSGGKIKELLLSPGTHTVGVAGGIRRCKNPATIDIDGFPAYRMTVTLRGLTFNFSVSKVD